MLFSKRFRILAAASLGAWSLTAGAAKAQSTDNNPSSTAPTTAELEAKVDALETKVNQLEGKEDELQANEAATIKQVLADADEHTQFLPGNIQGGYAPSAGFVIRSADGNFTFHPGVVLDFREMTSYREDTPAKGGGETAKTGYDTQSGFDVTRARLVFDGTINKNVGYYVQFQDDQGTAFNLLDAYASYRFDDSPFGVKVGQFKDPWLHERNLSEARLLAVDRSLVESYLGGGQTARVQGAALTYDQDKLRGQLVVHDGFNSTNTKFFDAGGIGKGDGGGAGVTPTDYGVSGRGEYMIIGDRTKDSDGYKEYDQFTALGDKQDILVAGTGFDYSQAGDNDVYFHTADLQYDTTSGWSFYGAYLGSYRDLHTNQGVTPGNYYDPGALAQVAYLVTPKIEPFARYDYTYLAGGSVSGLNKYDVQEITVGANYYLYGQIAKFTLDGSWLPEGAPTDSDALGVLQDSGHNEFVLRAQFQLAI
jgi:Phosphate-selective porin O and P